MPVRKRGGGSPLAAFEGLLESLVERSLVAPWRGPIHPREIARRLDRAMQDGAMLEVDRQLAPNQYEVRLHPDDLEPLVAARGTLEGELANYVGRSGGELGYTFLGLPVVRLAPDDAVPRRTIRVEAQVREGEAARANAVSSTAAPAGGRAPSRPALSGWRLTVAGRHLPLPFGTLRLGRAPDCEVVLPSPHVSRYHAEIVVDANGARLRDLGSRNGTTVEGQAAAGQPLSTGARISFGGVDATFERDEGDATSA